mgnify:CR=1 FL=1
MLARKPIANHAAPGASRASVPPHRASDTSELPLLALQRAIGNAAVTRLISRTEAAAIQRTPEEAFKNFTDSCTCGEDLGNNCAHYLSDAFIRAGYSELDGGKGGLYRRKKGRTVCKHGRPVRARELETWFAAKAKQKSKKNDHSKPGFWAVWQGGGTYWGGHVAVHEHKGKGTPHDVRGTGDYPQWPTQNHYTW